MTVDEDTITIKRCHVNHCQVCGKPFGQIEVVFFVPLDNNLVCKDCAEESGAPVEPRIYFEET